MGVFFSSPELGDALSAHSSQNIYTTNASNSTSCLPTVAFVSQYISQGCWVDGGGSQDFSKRDLSLFQGEKTALTLEHCAEECTGYTYFGVQYGLQCKFRIPKYILVDADLYLSGFCGNSLAEYATLARDQSECNYPCLGDPCQLCGGYWRMNVYSSIFSSASCSSSITASSTSSSMAGTIDTCVRTPGFIAQKGGKNSVDYVRSLARRNGETDYETEEEAEEEIGERAEEGVDGEADTKGHPYCHTGYKWIGYIGHCLIAKDEG